jgi:hypothetical protein
VRKEVTKATKASRTPASSARRLEDLEKIFVKLSPEAEPGGLAAEMVRVLASPGSIDGARIWRLVDGAPAIWQESGKLPSVDATEAARRTRSSPSFFSSSNGLPLVRAEDRIHPHRLQFRHHHGRGDRPTDQRCPLAGKKVQRRFTNIWKKDGNTWCAIVRHANVVSAQ